MSEDGEAPGGAMRVVLELSGDSGTVSGTLTTAEGSRRFWGWLELMSALELASGGSAGGPSLAGSPSKAVPEGWPCRANSPPSRPGSNPR